MSMFLDDVKDYCTAFGEWMFNHRTDTLFVAIVVAIVWAMLINIEHAAADHRQQVDLCVRAFEYSRDQCEFIVTNHIMVNR